jgi:hypothetical protein
MPNQLLRRLHSCISYQAPDHERALARRELAGDLGHELRGLRRQPARAGHRHDTGRKGRHAQLAARHPHQRGQPQGQRSGQGGRIGRHAHRHRHTPHRPAAAGEPPHGERAAAPPAPRRGKPGRPPPGNRSQRQGPRPRTPEPRPAAPPAGAGGESRADQRAPPRSREGQATETAIGRDERARGRETHRHSTPPIFPREHIPERRKKGKKRKKAPYYAKT